jgi:hypothetical protein
VGLFGPLQTHYRKAVEDYFLTTNIGINRDLFFPLYKKARTLTYTKENITEAFRKCGIVPFNPRTVLRELPKPQAARSTNTTTGSFPLDKTPYTKCQLRQQTNQALTFIKNALHGEICNLILRFSHSLAEYFATTAEIAHSQAEKLCETLKEIPPGKKDRRQIKNSDNLSGVMTGGGILDEMQIRDQKDEEKGSQGSNKGSKASGKEGSKRSCRSSISSSSIDPGTPQHTYSPSSMPRSSRCSLSN